MSHDLDCASCVDNIVHALTGRHSKMPSHTRVTSMVRDQEHGVYALESVPRQVLEGKDAVTGGVGDELIEIALSQYHLPLVSASDT